MRNGVGPVIVTMSVMLGVLFCIVPQVAFAFDANRIVSFQGRQMTCQQVYNLSEDQDFAASFQDLRKSAIKWRSLSQQAQDQLNRGAKWGQVNNVLRELTYAVGAVNTIRSIVTGDAALEGAKAAILASLGVPDVTSVQGGLEALNVQIANANDRTWVRLRNTLQGQLRTCMNYAQQYERDSSNVIRALIDARRVLQSQCR